MKMWKKILSVCFLALCMLFVGKTDTQAATYTLPVSDSWTDGELTQQGGYNFYRVTIPEESIQAQKLVQNILLSW